MSRKGGVLSGGFQPLKAPNAPTIDSVSAGVLSADVTVSAPANTGDGTVSGYVVTAKQSDGSLATGTASSAGAVSVTLTAGGTTEFAAQAFSEYGPGQFSGFGNSTSVPSGQELYAWGSGSSGRTGLNTTVNTSSPTQVGSLTTWAQVSARSSSSIAIKADGTLWAWGAGTVGQLGNDSGINVSSPIQVGSLTNWSQVSMWGHCVAIKTDGTLWSWGSSQFGQLGHNNAISRSSPVQVGALTTWSQASAGSGHTAAVKTDGTLWTWGNAASGRLGDNNLVARSSPIQIGALTNWIQVSCGSIHTTAVKTDGTMWSWGANGNGQLGLNISYLINRSSPVQIGALTTWAQVSGGFVENGAIKTDGTMWSWGSSQFGQLGHNDTVDRSSPVQVGALTTWSQVSTSGSHMAAIKTDGTLWTWGNNGAGQLGQNLPTITDRSSPVQVGALTTWYQVSAGNASITAIDQSFT